MSPPAAVAEGKQAVGALLPRGRIWQSPPVLLVCCLLFPEGSNIRKAPASSHAGAWLPASPSPVGALGEGQARRWPKELRPAASSPSPWVKTGRGTS